VQEARKNRNKYEEPTQQHIQGQQQQEQQSAGPDYEEK